MKLVILKVFIFEFKKKINKKNLNPAINSYDSSKETNLKYVKISLKKKT